MTAYLPLGTAVKKYNRQLKPLHGQINGLALIVNGQMQLKGSAGSGAAKSI